MSDRLALTEAIEAGGIERAKATRIASVIFDAIHQNVATKADIQASEASLRSDVVALRAELQASDAALRADLRASDTRLNARIDLIEHRLMTRLGALAVVLSGIIIAVLHYWQPH